MRNFTQQFGLARSSDEGVLPYLSAQGAFHGQGVALLEKDAFGRWRPRAQSELKPILSAGYGFSVDLSARMHGLAAVAQALNNNQPCRASPNTSKPTSKAKAIRISKSFKHPRG